MKRINYYFYALVMATIMFSETLFDGVGHVWAADDAQSQSGIIAIVIYTEPINVRGGPSTVYYDIIGRAFPGDVLPALGVSVGREWVKVEFPQAPGGTGWVYAAYVSISGGELPIAEAPPTPTPLVTMTINPTFAAAFQAQPTQTRLPTFTPPPPLVTQSYGDESLPRSSGLPFGWVLVVFAALGGLILFFSYLFDRR